MATYNELKQRISELKSRTGRSSISPGDTFGLVEELLDKLEGVDMNAASMSVQKTYSSYAAMTADNNPTGDDGRVLKSGQLVAVDNEDNVSENAIYRFLKPGWEKVDRLGDLTAYAKTGGSEKTVKDVEDEIVQLAGDIFVPNIFFEQGTLNDTDGGDLPATNRVRSHFLNYELYSGFKISGDYEFLSVRGWDREKNYISSLSAEMRMASLQEIRLTDRTDIAYIKLIIKRKDNGNLTPGDFNVEVIGLKRTVDQRIDQRTLPVLTFDASLLTIPGINIRLDGTEETSTTDSTDYTNCEGYDILEIEMLRRPTVPRFGVSFYERNKSFIKSYPRLTGEDGSVLVGYDVPENAAFFRVGYDKSETTPFTAKLIKIKDEYSEYSEIVPDRVNHAGIFAATGKMWKVAGDNNSATDFINIENIDKIRLPMRAGTSLTTMSGIAFYDIDKNYITGYTRPYSPVNLTYAFVTHNVPEGAAYMRSTWCSDDFLAEHPDFPEYKITLITSAKKEQGLSYQTAQRVKELESKVKVLPFYISGDFSQNYDFDYTGPTGSAMASQTMGDVYALYDQLLSEFPDILEKNLLGYATAPNGSTNMSFPIYEYVIRKPEEPSWWGNEVPMTPPATILLSSSVHGLEKISVQALYEFINSLIRDWRENELLENLLFNFEYRIIPLANPVGYTNNTRNNARNVNINRNFAWNWESQTGDDVANKGDAPLSELETQVLANWFEINKDALLYIDFHDTLMTSNVTPGTLISYQNTLNEDIRKVYSTLIRKMSRRWIDKYDIQTNNRVLGFTSASEVACTYAHAYHITKIRNASIIEINRTLWGQSYSQTACEIHCGQVVNYLCSLIDYEVKRATI